MPSGVDDSLGLGTAPVDVAEPHLDAADHGVLELVEEGRVSALHPTRPPPLRVHDQRRRRRLGIGPERLRQGPDELAQGSLDVRRRRRCRSRNEEQGASLARRQPRQVGAGATQQTPAPSSTLRGVDGHPGHGERVEVSSGGALGDFQFPRDLRRRHLLALLKQEQGGHQPVGSHMVDDFT